LGRKKEMSDFLASCLRTAIIVAFGMAMLFFIFSVVTIAIIGAITGPGDFIAVAAVLPIALAGALILGAAVFISNVVACIIADNQRAAEVQAGRPGGGGQALEDKDKTPRCPLCERLSGLILVSSALAILMGVIVSRS
jgi:hypothetical protein